MKGFGFKFSLNHKPTSLFAASYPKLFTKEKTVAGRYLITGVQLGMIKGFITSNKVALVRLESLRKAVGLLDEIEEKQFVGNSNYSIEIDLEEVNNIFKKDI